MSRRAPRRSRDTGVTLPGLLDAFEFRSIGPFRSGRVGAVAGDPSQTRVFYFGSSGGGIWKTTDGGGYWSNVSDRYFRRASVGALAVAPSDPNVIYVGMGESCIRENVSHGDGVYRSTDGGSTWSHLGLTDTRNIGSVRVDPRDPDTVYVAALGHTHGPNAERGLYRSTDGGRRWRRVLSRGRQAGAIDLSIDLSNPRVIYCSFWEAVRRPWSLVSGGPGSGLFRSRDGGNSWTELTHRPELPSGPLGRIGVAASPAKGGLVYAIFEAADGAVFRSEDGGETWQRRCDDMRLRIRPFYYHHIIADPLDPDTVWVLNTDLWRSVDGGRTFATVQSPHPDHHALWIDPRDSRRMILGHDGGASVSFDGAETWSAGADTPTAEIYHVTTDARTPYHVYGAQQDNTTIGIPSHSPSGAITASDTYGVGGGESGYVAVRPDDPDIAYAGYLMGTVTRHDRRTGQARNIDVWPEASWGWAAKDLRYRFAWTFPIALSPHDPDVLYVAGNRIFRSRDEGTRWEPISPDLTRNDRTKLQASGGPLTLDNCGAEYYCTIFAFSESPKLSGVLWAGSDDGLVHVSRDGGKRWSRVTPPGLPQWSLVSVIEPSPHDPAVAYVAATRYMLDDFRPYIFRTADYGRTWKKITGGIPSDDFVRVIREDPLVRGLLFAGTETGVYISFDDGQRWHRFQGNLPAVPVHDLVVKDADLVIATHGRGFWIVDDITALRQDFVTAVKGRPHLFIPRTTVRFRTYRPAGTGAQASPKKNWRRTATALVTWRPRRLPTGEFVDAMLDAGQNPPAGVIVRYYLPPSHSGRVSLKFLDRRGRVIQQFTSEHQDRQPTLTAAPGMNTFFWDTRYPGAAEILGDPTSGSIPESSSPTLGPLAAPGQYRVVLGAGGRQRAASFRLEADPRSRATQRDLESQFALLIRLRDKLGDTHEAVNEIRRHRMRFGLWRGSFYGKASQLSRGVDRLDGALSTIEDELVQTKMRRSIQEAQVFPVRLNAKLGALASRVASADAPPTQASQELANELVGKADLLLARLRAIANKDIPRLDELIAADSQRARKERRGSPHKSQDESRDLRRLRPT